MFDFFKKKDVEIYAPVIGDVVLLEDVPDKMFAQKMLGDGVAFNFKTDTIYAPCNASVVMIAMTKHAIGLQVNDVEIMIHIGLETVNFNGEGFTALVEQGDKVKKGQPLIKIDRQFFESKGVNLITPMVITSRDSEVQLVDQNHVDLESMVIKVH